MDNKEDILLAIENVINLLTGMQFDPTIPSHAKEIMRREVAKLELILEMCESR